jgi:ketosteroid isomerase-like protein
MMVVMTPRELMTDYLAAAKRGDWDSAFDFFAEDMVIHVPGRSAFAGDRLGRMPRSATSRRCATATATGASSSS